MKNYFRCSSVEIGLENVEIKTVATPESRKLSRPQMEWPGIQNILDSRGIQYRVTDRKSYRHDLLNIYLSTHVKALTTAPETSSDFGHGIWTIEMCQPVFIETDHVLAPSETQSLFSYKHF
jgi:hypothetical protein